jgi:hypothetical protein
MSRRLTMLALLVAIAAGAASSAVAASGTVRPLQAGPVFVGDGGLAWATYDRDLVDFDAVYGFVVRRRSADGQVHVIGVSTRPPLYEEQRDPYLLSSREALVAGSIRRTVGSKAVPTTVLPAEVLTWDADGTARARLGPCTWSESPSSVQPEALDLDGDTVVDCDQDGRHVDLFDARTGVRTDQIATAAQPVSARIAGRYVAWLEPSAAFDAFTLVVFDRVARAERLRVATTTLGDGSFTAWDLGTDGTIVYVLSTGRRGGATAPGHMSWTSVVDPRPHAVPVGVVRWPMLRLEGRTITYTSVAGAAYELRTARLDGTASRTIAHGVTRDFDVRGGRVAFGVAGCEEDRLRVQALNAPTYTPPRRACALVAPRRLTAQHDRVRVKIGCRGLPFTCDGELILRSPDRTGALLGHADLDAGTATIHLKAAARRALRHSPTLRARLSARVPAEYDEARVRVRSRDVTIVRGSL